MSNNYIYVVKWFNLVYNFIRWKSMKNRVIGSFIILFLFIGSLSLGSKIFNILMCLCGIISFIELFEIKFEKDKLFIKIMGVLNVLAILANMIIYNSYNYALYIIPILSLILPILIYNDKKKYNITDAIYVLGICYFISISFISIIKICNIDILKCVYIFVVAFITDTYAFIGGNLIGRTKLSNISPNKTVEGTLIGVILGTMIGTVYYYNFIGSDLLFVIFMSLILSIVGEIGDLVFSYIKRDFNKKDYSNIIPGHGGMLDRFDSVIFIALVFMIFLNFI